MERSYSRRSYRVQFPGGSEDRLAGIVDRPDGIADVPVVVFSHCFTCNKDLKAIVRISRGLAERGIAVLRFDMTGLGGSEGDFSRTSFTTNLADLRAALRFAGGELGTPTGLIGHSFGGAVSLAVAGSGDGGVSAVVTLAAPSDTQHLAWLLAQMSPEIETAGIGEVSIGGRQWSVRKEMLADFRRHDLPASIARIRAATLLFHSPVDRTVGFDHAIRIMGLIQSAPGDRDPVTPVSLVTLAGADHLLAETPADIEFVADTAAAFLGRYARP